MENRKRLIKQVRIIIAFFVLALVVSGISAFPIESELQFAVKHISVFPKFLQAWLTEVYTAVKTTNSEFPFLSYGTDWLAFAHIVIAVAFIGPFMDPVKNIWVVIFGMIACVSIIPLALIAGYIRGIPFYWQVIDCSFGVFGIVPLMICYRKINQLAKIQQE